MKAAYADRYGPPQVVKLREVERPTPTGDQVLIRVRAASVNRADLDGLKPKPGFLRLFMGIRAPRNQEVGIDAAGIVEAVGPEATRIKPGDAVMTDLFASGRFGAFAEYVCARERAVQPIPAGLSFEEAATLPHSAILALQGMRLLNGRTFAPGAEVLIDGASGNVGPFAVQVAKALGAEVTGVASGDKLDFVPALGGNLVMSRFGDRWSGLMLWWKAMHPQDVERLGQLIASGQVTPRIDRRYPLDQVADALAWVEDGHARGKVVVTVADS